MAGADGPKRGKRWKIPSVPNYSDGKTYLLIEGDIALTVANMKVKLPLGEDTLALTVNLNMKGKESTLFDEATGAIMQDHIKLTGTTNVILPGAEDAMKMDSTTEVTTVRAK